MTYYSYREYFIKMTKKNYNYRAINGINAATNQFIIHESN